MLQVQMLNRETARLYAENRKLKRAIVLLLIAGTATWIAGLIH